LKLVQYADSLETAIQHIKNQEGCHPKIITTTAAEKDDQLTFKAAYQIKEPILLLFGTGNGLAEEVHSKADYVLESVKGGDYNHLSVRSAAAIVLDRLTSDK